VRPERRRLVNNKAKRKGRRIMDLIVGGCP
jgi:hypothetical protein